MSPLQCSFVIVQSFVSSSHVAMMCRFHSIQGSFIWHQEFSCLHSPCITPQSESNLYHTTDHKHFTPFISIHSSFHKNLSSFVFGDSFCNIDNIRLPLHAANRFLFVAINSSTENGSCATQMFPVCSEKKNEIEPPPQKSFEKALVKALISFSLLCTGPSGHRRWYMFLI